VLEEQQLDSGGLVLAVQTSGTIWQEEEQDGCVETLLADEGVCRLEN